jgi:hypothetical protein
MANNRELAFPEFPPPEFDPASLGFPMDQSWGNDACPSHSTLAAEGGLLKLWADHPDPSLREVPGAPRFTVVAIDPDENCRTVFSGETVEELTRYCETGLRRDMEALGVLGELESRLMDAVRGGEAEGALWLIGCGARGGFADMRGRTTLQLAIDRGMEPVALALAGVCDDLAETDDDRCSAMHYAAGRDMTTVMDALEARGADISAKDADGEGPLHHAAFHGKALSAAWLLAKGAEVDTPGFHLSTPLMVSADNLAAGVCRLLLDAGADATARDLGGLAAIDRLAIAVEEQAGRGPIMAERLDTMSSVLGELMRAGAAPLVPVDGRTALSILDASQPSLAGMARAALAERELEATVPAIERAAGSPGRRL